MAASLIQILPQSKMDNSPNQALNFLFHLDSLRVRKRIEVRAQVEIYSQYFTPGLRSFNVAV